MCLILIAYRCHQTYPLLVVANRDEFYDRPAAPLAFWEDHPNLIAGRDLKAGGTWLGMTTTGRFAGLTNYRDPAQQRPSAPSRGHLVSAYLQGKEPAHAYLERLAPQAKAYNGFNLLVGDGDNLFYYSNLEGPPRALTPGLYGLSNHFLNTPWPKVERGRAALAHILAEYTDPTPEQLLSILTDRTPAPDTALPQTGIPLDWERWLSPLFITTPDYGTRASTLLLVSTDGIARMIEVTWPAGTRQQFDVTWATCQ
jgi:uncharacterized protein with NRDE domain